MKKLYMPKSQMLDVLKGVHELSGMTLNPALQIPIEHTIQALKCTNDDFIDMSGVVFNLMLRANLIEIIEVKPEEKQKGLYLEFER